MKRLFILTGLLLLTGALFNRTIAQNRENQVREQDRKSTRLNSSHSGESRMPSSA